MILKMITNKSLFHPDNLLLDPEDPFSDPIDDGYYSDVNSGEWLYALLLLLQNYFPRVHKVCKCF